MSRWTDLVGVEKASQVVVDLLGEAAGTLANMRKSWGDSMKVHRSGIGVQDMTDLVGMEKASQVAGDLLGEAAGALISADANGPVWAHSHQAAVEGLADGPVWCLKLHPLPACT